jgi:hypothetical protein
VTEAGSLDDLPDDEDAPDEPSSGQIGNTAEPPQSSAAWWLAMALSLSIFVVLIAGIAADLCHARHTMLLGTLVTLYCAGVACSAACLVTKRLWHR